MTTTIEDDRMTTEVDSAVIATATRVGLTGARTASNDAVNCPARSWTRNRKSAARSPGSISRLRICCTVHGPSGFAVTLRMCT
jgi:hypothetical protein